MPNRLAASDHLPSAAEMLPILEDLRREMDRAERDHGPLLASIAPNHSSGARNLLDYLSLRRHDLRHLQRHLAAWGLSSLGRAESHVRASLEAVIPLIRGQPVPESAARAHVEGRRSLEGNTVELFGEARPGRSTRILVTASPETAEDPSLLRRLLDAGMDALRINCAHDGPAAWERMIANLRAAEASTGRRSRILMDLAGPKLRTAAKALGPRVLRVRPERDLLGRPTAPARVLLHAEGRPAPVRGIPLPAAFLSALRPGDRIGFSDARGKSRYLDVAESQGECRWAEAPRGFYLESGTVLHLEDASGRADSSVVGTLPPAEDPIRLRRGDRLLVVPEEDLAARGGPPRIGCTLPEIFGHARAGQPIWFDDGKIGGVVRAAGSRALEVEITCAREGGSPLRGDKGINLPGIRWRMPALGPADLSNLAFAAKHADMVGLSFVAEADHVHEVRERLQSLGAPGKPLLLKIETACAFDNLPELLLAAMRSPSCGVMIARGDLAVECGFERMAEVQEEILWMCEAAHLPVVWATQVLESMARSGRPSRAEVTDAAMGNRAECVMLNKGPYLVEAVLCLDDILRRMEAHQDKKRSMLRPLRVAEAFFGRRP